MCLRNVRLCNSVLIQVAVREAVSVCRRCDAVNRHVPHNVFSCRCSGVLLSLSSALRVSGRCQALGCWGFLTVVAKLVFLTDTSSHRYCGFSSGLEHCSGGAWGCRLETHPTGGLHERQKAGSLKPLRHQEVSLVLHIENVCTFTVFFIFF